MGECFLINTYFLGRYYIKFFAKQFEFRYGMFEKVVIFKSILI